jgi:hypothetical protein
MPHVVLLGDSIFDNASYTAGEPDVVTHLRRILPAGWVATLAAVDGATTANVPAQLRALPEDATHLVLSVGGNDALGNIDLLSTAVRSTAEALRLFARRTDLFAANYARALAAAAALRRTLVICTIYNGAFPDADQANLTRVALATFNDRIILAAFEHGAGLIDLRLVCTDASDYANPIEPSGQGGRKIALAIAHAVGALPGTAGTRVTVT